MTVEESGRRTQAERRRDATGTLLAAAAALIAELGPAGASFTAISERAGTARGLPTHHFGSKDGLVAAVADTAQDGVAAAMQDAARDARELSGLERIRLLSDVYLGLFEHPDDFQRALLVLWGATFPTGSNLTGMEHAEERARAGWADRIEEGRVDGSVRPGVDPVTAGVVLHGVLRGVAARMIDRRQESDPAVIRAEALDWIIRALAT